MSAVGLDSWLVMVKTTPIGALNWIGKRLCSIPSPRRRACRSPGGRRAVALEEARRLLKDWRFDRGLNIRKEIPRPTALEMKGAFPATTI